MHETIECRQVHEAIRARAELEGALRRHVEGCSACAELFCSPGHGAGGLGNDATLGHTLADAEHDTGGSAEIEAMFTRIEQQLAQPPGPVERVRRASTRTRSIMLFGIATSIVVLALGTLNQVDFSIYPLPHLLGSIAALVTAALASGAVVVRPIHRRPLPGWLLGVLAGFAVITPGVIASVPTTTLDHPSASVGTGKQLFEAALSCFAIGMSFALLLVGAAWLVERSGLRRRAATVLGLVGAGALGNLVLVLHCPIVAPAHKLLGHASISAVLLAVAGGLAWVLIRERPRR
jgi:hypothetical protein